MSMLTRIPRFTAVALVTSALLSLTWGEAVAQQSTPPPAEPRRFETPEEASRALIGALRSGTLRMLTDVLGPDLSAVHHVDHARLVEAIRAGDPARAAWEAAVFLEVDAATGARRR